MIPEKRRYKLLYLHPQQIIDNLFLVNIKDIPNWDNYCFNKLSLPDLPVNYAIRHVEYDYKRMAFAFMIYSESFDIVPEWDIPPTLNIKYEIVKVDLKTLPQLVVRYANIIGKYGIDSEHAKQMKIENTDNDEFISYANSLDRIKKSLGIN